jgi:hypothetical protein
VAPCPLSLSEHTDCHLGCMHTRADPVEPSTEDRDHHDSPERPQERGRPPARAPCGQAAKESAVVTGAAEFERLRARLPQLVGTNNTKV